MNNIAMVLSDRDGLNVCSYTDSYEFIRSAVGGYLELVPNSTFNERDIDVWCNEEGKFDSSLRPSVALQCDGRIYDIVAGNIVFTRHDGEGETISLTDDDILFIKNWYDNTDWHISADMSMMIPIMNY